MIDRRSTLKNAVLLIPLGGCEKIIIVTHLPNLPARWAFLAAPSKPLLNQPPPMLVLIQVKLLDGHSPGSLAIGHLDRAEIFAATADDDDAPA
jgi:hypothetical protein